jgi:hypothetical protein
VDVGQSSSGPAALEIFRRLGFTVEPLGLPTESETTAALYDLLLATFPKPVETSEVYRVLADQFVLSESQRTLTMTASSEVHWENRVRQARRKLVDLGVLDGAEGFHRKM